MLLHQSSAFQHPVAAPEQRLSIWEGLHVQHWQEQQGDTSLAARLLAAAPTFLRSVLSSSCLSAASLPASARSSSRACAGSSGSAVAGGGSSGGLGVGGVGGVGGVDLVATVVLVSVSVVLGLWQQWWRWAWWWWWRQAGVLSRV
jgi:hypothetical protein